MAAADTSTDTDSWQPSADERGDIARALFYMDVRYDGGDANTTDLVLENQITYTADMAVLGTLLRWSHDDPVDEVERKRNTSIYTFYQHNRNPFVDHPEYADLIFGSAAEQAADIDLDGMPSDWELTYQLNPSDPHDANVDGDYDGFSHFEEYWMGSDPTNASDPTVLHVDGAYSGSLQDGSSDHPYKTIQAAINAASPSQRCAILVRPGTYNERPYITGKNKIYLFGEHGPTQTIIDGQGVNSSVVRFDNFQKAAFVGFTVRNASTSGYGAGLRGSPQRVHPHCGK